MIMQQETALSKFKLLALLGSNQDKIDSLKDVKNPEELWAIYEYLSQQNDNCHDYSFVTDKSVKREILKKEELNSKVLWNIFQTEKDPELKKSGYNYFLMKTPLVLCPKFSYCFLTNINHVADKTLIYAFTLSWALFLMSIVYSAYSLSIVPVLGSFILLNTMWFLSGGYISSKFHDFLIGGILILCLPIIIPLFLFFASSFLCMVYTDEFLSRF